jgi:hypothetical protein
MDPSANNPIFSLRSMLREEGKNNWVPFAWWGALVLVSPTVLIAGFVFDSLALAFLGFVFILSSFAAVIPLGILTASYEPDNTRRQIHFTLASLGDVDQLLDEIDSELAADDGEVLGAIPSRFRRQTRGTLVLTDSWVLWFGWTEFRFFPISRIVWIYKQIEISPAWWAVSDRRQVELAIVTRANTQMWLRIHCEDFADEAMKILIRKCPEALYGLRTEWKELAGKSIAAILEEVARRRAALEKASPEERAEWRNDCLADARHFVRRVDTTAAGSATNY